MLLRDPEGVSSLGLVDHSSRRSIVLDIAAPQLNIFIELEQLKLAKTYLEGQ